MVNDFYSYDYGMYPEMDNLPTEFLALIGGIVLIVLLIAMIVGVISYVLTGVGFYTIAKRREIKHPWMAWVPVLNSWLLGSISDQYQYVVKGRVKNRRKLLLGLELGSLVLGIASGVLSVVLETAEAELVMLPALALIGVALLSVAVSIVYAVFYYMALYDLYSSCNPTYNVMFLVLGIFFSIAQPFFIFFNRNKDKGMPPRKPVYQQIPNPAWQPSQPPQEPWNP